MNIRDAVSQSIPVLVGIEDNDGLTRVWCDRCFRWHFHGGPGLKVPHCPYSAGWYYITTEGNPNPDDCFAYRYGTRWKTHCHKCNRNHIHQTIGAQFTPHHYSVVPRPGPGSPVFCQATGKFYNLETAEVVDPGYTDYQLAFYQYHVTESWLAPSLP